MNLSEFMSSYSDVIILGLSGVVLILLIFIIVISVKQRKLNKKYLKFMTGANGENLEGQILARFEDIDNLKAEAKKIKNDIVQVNDNLLITFQKVGVVKYDAFKEMGGKLSFVLTLLDKNNNGIMINSVHSSREGCYTYLKEIIKGESFLELSADEKKSLSQALNSNNFMA
ncbi:MAG: putative rane protein [Herbinix sp.]|jgi:hypothetical protein|nr:putative rane protein [Herbinix sp.]